VKAGPAVVTAIVDLPGNNVVLSVTVPVVGPVASLTAVAAPTTLRCGEKSTITITAKDAAGQNVSDRTLIDIATNFGGVIGGTSLTTGAPVVPISSAQAETFAGVATAYLLTSEQHSGPYEVVVSASDFPNAARIVQQVMVTCIIL